MTLLHKHRISSILKWVPSNFVDSHSFSSFCIYGSNPKLYRNLVNAAYSTDKNNDRLSGESDKNNDRLSGESDKNNDRLSGEFSAQTAGFISPTDRKDAQAALLNYFHYTRNFLFSDAENMSKNSPVFLNKLLEKVGAENNVGKSVSKYLRYSPINEFEPFYESLGLLPHEYTTILPRDLMFLRDDDLLMENYKVLCCYGIERKTIGNFFKEAPEIFRYGYGVLELKLEAYEKQGLSNSFVAMLVTCSPCLLIGNVNEDLIEVLQTLRKLGIELNWIEKHLSDKTCYNWSRLLALLNLLFHIGGNNGEMLGCLISLHPVIIFEDSGNRTLLLVNFLVKFGFNNSQICAVFEGLPKIPVATFVSNMKRSFQILRDINMEASEIRKMIHSHVLLLGSYKLKQSGSLLLSLNVGKKRLCKFIQQNPLELKTLAIGSKIERLPSVRIQSKMLRMKFLVELGLMGEQQIAKALRRFRGSGAEIQERFNCLVEAGLDEKDVCEMVKVAPEILNLSKDVIKRKIDFLVNDLGYPVSTLVSYPTYLCYKNQRVSLRLAMYGWLQEQGTCDKRSRNWKTFLSYSDKKFVQRYVKRHPRGLEVWEDLKRRIYSESGSSHLAQNCADSAILMETQ